MNSAIYEGTIRHRRVAERKHEFCHRLAMAYLDLDELDRGALPALMREDPGLVRFRRSDYLGDPAISLRDSVRAVVCARLGHDAALGPIRLLTHLRWFGYCFNPVSLYYCFSRPGERLQAIVADVTNTPWGQRHAYVLACGNSDPEPTVRGSLTKALHVSPFMAMDQRYEWRGAAPGPTLSLHIASIEAGERVFDATLNLVRRPFDRSSLVRVTVRYPAPTQRLVLLIYAHAAAIKLRGVTVKQPPGVGLK